MNDTPTLYTWSFNLSEQEMNGTEDFKMRNYEMKVAAHSAKNTRMKKNGEKYTEVEDEDVGEKRWNKRTDIEGEDNYYYYNYFS